MLPYYCRLLVFLGIFFLSPLSPVNAKMFIDERFISGSTVASTSTSYLLASNIIEDIHSGKFNQADERIRQIGMHQPSIIARTIAIIYQANVTHYDMLLANCTASSKSLIIYSIFYQFCETIKSNKQTDIYDLMYMYEKITTEIIHKEQTAEEIRVKTQDMLDYDVRDAIIRIAGETLKAAVIDENYRNNSNITRLVKALESVDEKISDDTIRKVVEELYTKMPITDLIRNLYNNESISQSALALVSIYQSLSSEDDLHGVIGMVFADHLSRLQELPDYEKLSEDKKNAVARVVSRISSSISNLYFAHKICIRNALYLEDMYSPEDRYAWRETRRNVFTQSQAGLANVQTQWIPRKYGDEGFQFQFESEFNKDEYLYVPSVERYKYQFRRVMTVIPREDVGVGYTAVWQIEAIKNEMVLLNVHYNEYLCLSDEKYSANLRFVFTKRDEHQITHPKECRWVVNAC